jgi:hypothetical protein
VVVERDRIKIEQHSGIGLLWVAGWLFTIGYSDLSFLAGGTGAVRLALFPGRRSCWIGQRDSGAVGRVSFTVVAPFLSTGRYRAGRLKPIFDTAI